MSYIDGISGCCAAVILYDVDSTTSKQLREILNNFEENCLYAILDIKSQNRQVKLLISEGWKKIGRSWINPGTGNRLQTLIRYPTISRKEYLEINNDDEE